MTIIRVSHNKDNPYVILNKKVLEIPDLSLKAKGLWAYLISKPDNWKVSIVHLAKALKEGERSIRTGIDELKKFGLCEYRQPKVENGKWGKGEYILYEHPIFKKCLPRCGFAHAPFGHPAPYYTKEGSTNKNDVEQASEDVVSFSDSELRKDLKKSLSKAEVEIGMTWWKHQTEEKKQSMKNLGAYITSIIRLGIAQEENLECEAQLKEIQKNKDVQEEVKKEKMNNEEKNIKTSRDIIYEFTGKLGFRYKIDSSGFTVENDSLTPQKDLESYGTFFYILPNGKKRYGKVVAQRFNFNLPSLEFNNLIGEFAEENGWIKNAEDTKTLNQGGIYESI